MVKRELKRESLWNRILRMNSISIFANLDQIKEAEPTVCFGAAHFFGQIASSSNRVAFVLVTFSVRKKDLFQPFIVENERRAAVQKNHRPKCF